jgi:pimeloyl-ACP methyl ester carboxylesterase
MDNKILLIAAILGVILLVGVICPWEKLPVADRQAEVRGELIGTSRFVLEQAGVPVIEEAYTLFFSPEEGYILLSEATIVVGEETINLAQQYQLDSDFAPIVYHLGADTPSGSQIISAQMGAAGLQMEVLGVGDEPLTSEVPGVHNTLILDNNLVSHYVVLLMAAEAQAIDRDFTAAIPQKLLALPSSLRGPNTAGFTSGETAYQGKLYELKLGDLSVYLITYTGQLVGVAIPTQAAVAYNAELFPEGIAIELEEAPEVSPEGLLEEEVSFESAVLTLAGTLALPEGTTEPVPAALFIHGSGPIDRDGNAQGLKMDAYRQLAHALAQSGIGSLRYDKRGVGASQGVSEEASRNDLVGDVRAALEVLRAAQGIDPQRCFLIGHSEGCYLAPIVAAEDADLAGLVLLGAAGQSLDQITRWQVETLARMQGMSEEEIAAVLTQQDQYIAFVKGSSGEWSDYSAERLQEAMPWLTPEAAAQLKATPFSLSWLRQHYSDDPLDTIRQVTCPVLIINGEKDLQVPAAEAEPLKMALEEAGNDDVTALILPDLNHLLRHHPEDPSLVYRHIDDPIDPRVIETITDWLAEHSGL